jgi:hypothetical protein
MRRAEPLAGTVGRALDSLPEDTGPMDHVAKRLGRPPLAPETTQLPACTVPSPVYDAVALEALQRGVSMAQVQREAVISHLKSRQQDQTMAS